MSNHFLENRTFFCPNIMLWSLSTSATGTGIRDVKKRICLGLLECVVVTCRKKEPVSFVPQAHERLPTTLRFAHQIFCYISNEKWGFRTVHRIIWMQKDRQRYQWDYTTGFLTNLPPHAIVAITNQGQRPERKKPWSPFASLCLTKSIRKSSPALVNWTVLSCAPAR